MTEEQDLEMYWATARRLAHREFIPRTLPERKITRESAESRADRIRRRREAVARYYAKREADEMIRWSEQI